MKQPTAILADDHEIVIDGLQALLKGHVRIVATCSNGEELLEATRRLRPDLVIADISMPKMSGLEFLRAMREDDVLPKVILLSMYGDDLIVAAAFRAGALGYVPKHATGEELAATRLIRIIRFTPSSASARICSRAAATSAGSALEMSPSTESM